MFPDFYTNNGDVNQFHHREEIFSAPRAKMVPRYIRFHPGGLKGGSNKERKLHSLVKACLNPFHLHRIPIYYFYIFEVQVCTVQKKDSRVHFQKFMLTFKK